MFELVINVIFFPSQKRNEKGKKKWGALIFNSFILFPDREFYNAQDFDAHGHCVSILS